MLNKNYLLLTLRLYRGLIIFSALFVGFMQFLIVWIFASFDYMPVIEAFLNQLPQQMRVLFSEQFLTYLSINGAAAFGFNHPLVLLLLGLLTITASSRQIAGEAENGILELHLAYPIQRKTLFITLWFSISLMLFIVILCGLIGSLISLFLKAKLSLDIILPLLKIVVNLWILFVLVMSYSLLISSVENEGSKAGILSAVITLLFYFIFFLGSIWTFLDQIQILNIFHYYQPQKHMFHQISLLKNLSVLVVLIIICFNLGLRQFIRRDIP
ncbi:MAG: ABC transporter permease subunit [bacterium]|nr:MAG: ABC transporter permease subunit [bacterium]